MSGFNVLQLIDRVPDEAAAYRYLEDLRWGDVPECAHCGSKRATFLARPTAPAARPEPGQRRSGASGSAGTAASSFQS